MSDQLARLQSLSPPPLTVAILVLATLALVLVDAVVGRRDYTRFRAAEAREGERARLALYRRWIALGCATAAGAIALVAALPGVGPADIGLRLPDRWAPAWFRLPDMDAEGAMGFVGGFVVGLAILGAAVLIARRIASRRPAPDAPPAVPANVAAILPMLPRTRAGRWGWSGLSLSAGVTEEVTYRGVVILTLCLLLPDAAPAWLVVAAAAPLFGVAHWYQGAAGIAATGIVGAVFAALYLGTGSLIVPMILHTLIDLRALLVPIPPATEDARPG